MAIMIISASNNTKHLKMKEEEKKTIQKFLSIIVDGWDCIESFLEDDEIKISFSEDIEIEDF